MVYVYYAKQYGSPLLIMALFLSNIYLGTLFSIIYGKALKSVYLYGNADY